MERRAIGPRVGLLVAALAVGCIRPGVRAEGRGSASWGGDPSVSWAGPCAYEAQTRWATNLPYILRMQDEVADWSVTISARRAFTPGRVELKPIGQGGPQGLVMDGATVRGAVLGRVEVIERSDSTIVRIEGSKQRGDTVPFAAECRLGPPSAEG